MQRFILIIFFFSTLLMGCSSISKKSLNKYLQKSEERFQDQTGLVLYDVEKNKTVYEYNSDKYFTPASNTKIFTFFASLKIIGDSIPALRYIEQDDSLIFWGTGDPSFLYHKSFSDSRVFTFLKTSPKYLYFSSSNFNTTHLGSGWAWDDYNDYYSTERSPLPLYGNIVSVFATDSLLKVSPSYFQSSITIGQPITTPSVTRALNRNDFTLRPAVNALKKKWEIPYHVSEETSIHLLTDTLNRQVYPVQKKIPANAKILYSIPTDSLYKIMMQESDNFVAEQLLLLTAGMLSDTLQPEIAIRTITRNYLTDLKDKPIWVDGSGLSRYNLFTPRSIVQLWQKIYNLVPSERLYALLATGGKYGTIKNWYKADEPYIFGKTGTLSNNHCLSGFLITKSGKTLIFSFMNSNYISSVNDIRQNMQTILKLIYEKY